MASKRLLSGIKQTRPFASLHEEALVRLQFCGNGLQDDVAQFLKAYDLTRQHYNVLRILRGAGDEGLPSLEIASRMIERLPDMTRLLDRMEKSDLIRRERSQSDRRVVRIFLTKKGLSLVDKLDSPMQARAKERLAHMSKTQLNQLCDLLAAVG